jgi:ABC-type amino acid transport substrate-binding protein
MPVSLLVRTLFAIALLASANAGAGTLRIHYPDSGAPPYLYLTPGGDRPVGVVAEVLEAAAKSLGSTIDWKFLPREDAAAAVLGGQVDGAMFFSATRPPAAGLLVSDPLLQTEAVLVTPQGTPLDYRRPHELGDRRLCTLTGELYPPLMLLEVQGHLLVRKAKTEQAQVMMLENGGCVAAVLNGPMFQWLNARYHWDDLRRETEPLLRENVLLAFDGGRPELQRAVNRVLARLTANGELQRSFRRHLDGGLALRGR